MILIIVLQFLYRKYLQQLQFPLRKDPKQGYRMNSHWPNSSRIPSLPLSSVSHSPKQIVVHSTLVFSFLHWHTVEYLEYPSFYIIWGNGSKMLKRPPCLSKLQPPPWCSPSQLLSIWAFSVLSDVFNRVELGLSWQIAWHNKIPFSRKEEQRGESLFSIHM